MGRYREHMSLEPAQFQLSHQVVLDGWIGGHSASDHRVLLLHGFPQDSTAMLAVAGELVAGGVQVLVPDQRGYSPEARPPEVGDYALEHLVADVRGLLDAVGWERAHVVGHDWGAMVAWTLAATAPEAVESLIALSVPHPAAFARAILGDPDQQRRSAYVQLFQAPDGLAEQVLLAEDAAKLRAMYGSDLADLAISGYVERLSEPGALTAALNWYRAMELGQLVEIPAVDVPTTFVWGGTDVAIGRVAALGAADYVNADYEFVELSDQGHWLPETATPDVVAAIRTRLG